MDNSNRATMTTPAPENNWTIAYEYIFKAIYGKNEVVDKALTEAFYFCITNILLKYLYDVTLTQNRKLYYVKKHQNKTKNM